jgi:thymidine phosphorylase
VGARVARGQPLFQILAREEATLQNALTSFAKAIEIVPA